MSSEVNVPRRLLKLVLFAYAALAGGTVYAIKELIPSGSLPIRWTAGFILGFVLLTPALRLWEASRRHQLPTLGRYGLAVMQGAAAVAFFAWVWLAIAD
ncbi:MAG TPA: hypothetical protein VEK11_00810 [Thermoanaerobaculia bacterium]|nr:hypothetical protein [Thermoanaerobaculia bacterium]